MERDIWFFTALIELYIKQFISLIVNALKQQYCLPDNFFVQVFFRTGSNWIPGLFVPYYSLLCNNQQPRIPRVQTAPHWDISKNTWIIQPLLFHFFLVFLCFLGFFVFILPISCISLIMSVGKEKKKKKRYFSFIHTIPQGHWKRSEQLQAGAA